LLYLVCISTVTLSGTEVKTRHFRGNEELPWILNDKNYDFNFQQFRVLKNIVTVMPGDVITTECTYNSSLRSQATLVNLIKFV
jgi:hypothetical protein